MGTLRGDRVFVLHYDGFWMPFASGKVNYSMYRGVERCDYEVNGEEMCYLDFLKEIHRQFGDDKPVSCVKFIARGHLTYFNNDKDMLKMWDLIKPERDKRYHLFVTPLSFEDSLQPSQAQPSVNKPLKPPTSNKQPKILSTPKATNQINHEVRKSPRLNLNPTVLTTPKIKKKQRVVVSEVRKSPRLNHVPSITPKTPKAPNQTIAQLRKSPRLHPTPTLPMKAKNSILKLKVGWNLTHCRRCFKGLNRDNEGEEPDLVDEQPDLDGDNNDEDDDISAFVKLPKNLYCNPFYHVNAFRATYGGYIFPFDNEEDWGKIKPEDVVQPPPLERHPGRPKKQRIRGDDEKKAKSKRKCKKCLEPGHNKRTCPLRKDQPSKKSIKADEANEAEDIEPEVGNAENNEGEWLVIDVPEAEVQNLQNDVLRARRGGRASGRSGAGQYVNLQPVIDVPEAEPKVENLRYGTRSGTGRGGGRGLGWWLGEDSQPPSTPGQSTLCIVLSESLTQSQPQ
ncbi:hypothetical protein IFM89_018701 [Coptis chinensis]|uniref:CCHC-type domain-containing protein n=1 Tax=Coptis chinensis TaxID=261450 RepID=A0A835MFD7_9MAGN|nr:hypothetical protein IFM89_018701 [Coptis chinensis]